MAEKNVGRFTVGEDFDTKALAERALVEITAMGYGAALASHIKKISAGLIRRLADGKTPLRISKKTEAN